MIIGIFGDSFAVNNNNPLSWCNILEKTYSLQIKNYGYSCTTTFWSYRNLLKAIDDIDMVIFVVTAATRLYHPNEQLKVGTLVAVQQGLDDNELSAEDRAILQAAKQYHVYLINDEFCSFVQDQIIEEVRATCRQHGKKLIIVPAFSDSLKYQTLFDMPLCEIMWQEIHENFGDRQYRLENYHLRACHMSRENNEILAAKMHKLVMGETHRIRLEDFVFVKYADPSVYWKV